MNKSFCYLLAFCFVIITSFSLYAQEEPKYEISLIKKIFSMGTASVNGTYYPFGNAVARLLGRKIKSLVVIAEPTPGSIANVEYLRKKRIDLALMQSDVAWMAHQGSFNYSGNTFNELRVLASLYSEKIQIVVRADSGISSIKDLKGKKIAIGERESGSAAGAIQILETAGLKNGVDFELIYERFTKSTESLLDGYIDAVYYVGGVPADGIRRLADRIQIRLIDIPLDVINKLTSTYPYYCVEKINLGDYVKGQSRVIDTLGFKALLTCTDQLSENEAISMLNVLYANPIILTEQNDLDDRIELRKEDALKGVDASMLHPGAAKFFASQK